MKIVFSTENGTFAWLLCIFSQPTVDKLVTIATWKGPCLENFKSLPTPVWEKLQVSGLWLGSFWSCEVFSEVPVENIPQCFSRVKIFKKLFE